jgi:hypothetical protein
MEKEIDRHREPHKTDEDAQKKMIVEYSSSDHQQKRVGNWGIPKSEEDSAKP